MKNKITKLIVVAILFCSYNFTAFSQATVEFETITEALNYAGDRDAVKKLIITGTISGDDYFEDSEWSKFRTLDTTFPNIEDVEILTSQDIPDWDTRSWAGLFSYLNENNRSRGSEWLKNFSAPNTKGIGVAAFSDCENLTTINFPLATAIGYYAFAYCENLSSADFPLVTEIGDEAFEGCIGLTSINFPLAKTIKDRTFLNCMNLSSIDFPLVTTIGDGAFEGCDNLLSINFPLIMMIGGRAFIYCINLSSINFPLVTTIGSAAFAECKNLTSATFGTGFTMPTSIDFLYYYVFGSGDALTKNIDLTLREYVLPVPDLTTKIWQSDNRSVAPQYPQPDIDYVWKSITIKTSGIEEVVRNSVVNIFPNPTSENPTNSTSKKPRSIIAKSEHLF